VAHSVTHRCKYSGTCCFKIRRAVFNPSDLFVSSREPNDGMRTGSSTGTEGDGVGAAAAMAACALLVRPTQIWAL
jgi:hypothetical protein